jgi:hypothetical protein
MAIRANRPQVRHRVYLMLRPRRRNLDEVVHMDEASTHLAIGQTEVDSTYLTLWAIVLNAGQSCVFVTLMLCQTHFVDCALQEYLFGVFTCAR